jgi:hypothetical protein
MSEDSEDQSGPSKAPAAKVARKRPAVRKAGKSRPAPEAAEAPPAAAIEAPAVVEAAPAPRASDSAPAAEGFSDGHDSGRIAFLVESSGGEAGGNSKKRRRRKKKHGQQGQAPQHPHAVVPVGDSPPPPAPTHQSSHHAEQAPAPVMHAAPRPKLDSEQVAKKAWKIFQSEVGEEGLALIDDHDAREISRRCFRLAEIFLEEAARRIR